MIETKIVNEILLLNDPRLKGGYTTSFQFLDYRFDEDGGGAWSDPDYHNYVTYESSNGEEREALFIFLNFKA